MGLYDAFLIKENHIAACGGIGTAVAAARKISDRPVEVEVENLLQLEEALEAGVEAVLLDNFDRNELREAVRYTAGRAKLEASGNVTLASLPAIAETGVDYVSIGALTKDVRAVDLSMRFLSGEP
jgi:nicotinate-nucleotide pyrophosphorylase (carboxylating)